MKEEKNRKNYFVRVLIILLILLIGVMIGFKFFLVEPIGEFNSYIVILISFLLVLALSEAFDSFSIGELLKIRRELRGKEEVNRELKIENGELRKNIITLTTSINQNQTSNNIFASPELFEKVLAVRPADDKDIKNEAKEEVVPELKSSSVKKIDYKKIHSLEEKVLDEYLHENKSSIRTIIKEAKLQQEFTNVDPIANFNFVFDAYIKENDKEVFVQVNYIRSQMYIMLKRSNIYILLSRINWYKRMNQVNAFLVLILIFDKGMSETEKLYVKERIYSSFSPAIHNGLLRIEERYGNVEEG